MGFFEFGKLRERLRRTRESILGKVQSLISLRPVLDDELLAQLEETLISSDIGVATTERLISSLRALSKEKRFDTVEEVAGVLKAEMEKLFQVNGTSEHIVTFQEKPHVVMIVGVNGVGKTTTIGKLAHLYRSAGRKVLIAAADTFRAASNEQLEIWAQRAKVRIVQQSRGADPAAVAFDALKSAEANEDDVLIIDTAGRLHTKVNLMEELKKVKRVIGKQMAGAPHEILLVIDATNGQNAIVQARQFTEALGVTGIVLTKLDGTAKGGIIFSIGDELKVPVQYIGVGEDLEDLQPFDKKAFVEALFGD